MRSCTRQPLSYVEYFLKAIQSYLHSGTIYGRTSDDRTCHTAVSDGSVTITT